MSRKQAIDRFCKRCTYDPKDRGSWRKQVEECNITDCPLYSYRPITYKNTTKVK